LTSGLRTSTSAPGPPITVATDYADWGITVSLGCLTATVTVSNGGAGLDAAMVAVLEAAPGDIAALPAIAATRRAYKAGGKDPSRYRPSAEALLRRLRQGKGLYRVNNVVDVTNMTSIASGFSIGMYDRGLLEGPLTLRIATEGETYPAIGRGPINLAGLPVLCDASGPFGCPTSDSERTAISAGTSAILMVIFDFGLPQELPTALAQGAAWIAEHCGGRDIEESIL
jgi:DNA/RNA-binding domain of Phe-tRNA-synthetase-like protein